MPSKIDFFQVSHESPTYQKFCHKTNRLLSKFRKKLPEKATQEFDKISPIILTKFITSHYNAFHTENADLLFDILMIIITVTIDRKQKIKTKRILNNLDIIHQTALIEIHKNMHNKKKNQSI